MANPANVACRHRLQLLSETGVTTTTAGLWVALPPGGISAWYLKATFTEDSAGGITATVNGNETNSSTGELVIDNFGGAQSATGVVRTRDLAVSGTTLADSTDNTSYLPNWLQVDLSSVTGEWTVVVELWYARIEES